MLGIGVAMAASSVFALIFLGVASRWLGPERYASFMAAWGLVFGLAAAMLSAEQEIARQTTVAVMEQRAVPASVLQVAATSGVFALAALGLIAAVPAGSQALSGSWVVAAWTVLAVIGFTVQYLVRGVALGMRRTRDYIWIILGDGGLRLIAIALLAVAGLTASLEWALAAVVAGCFSWLLAPTSLRAAVDPRTSRQPWPQVAGSIGGLMVANALQAVLLTAYPTLVATMLGASAELSTFFGVVMLSRIPLVAASPVQTLAVPEATRLIHTGRVHVLVSLLVKIAVGLAAAVLVVGVAAYYLGPWVMQLFLGSQYEAASGFLVAVTLGAGCVMAVAMLQTSVLVALRRYALVTLSWAAGVVGAMLTLWLGPGSKPDRGAAGFMVGTVLAYLVSGASVLLSARAATATSRKRKTPAQPTL